MQDGLELASYDVISRVAKVSKVEIFRRFMLGFDCRRPDVRARLDVSSHRAVLIRGF